MQMKKCCAETACSLLSDVFTGLWGVSINPFSGALYCYIPALYLQDILHSCSCKILFIPYQEFSGSVSVSPWEAFSPHQKALSPVKQANRQDGKKKKNS